MILTSQKARTYTDFRYLFFFSCQQSHGLHVHGLREHVDRGDFLHFIAKSGEELCIASEGGWVAGDVDDARGLHAGRSG